MGQHKHNPDGMLSPPLEDSVKSLGTKRMSSNKSTKPPHRIPKRAGTTTAHTHLHSPLSPPDSGHSTHSVADGRHKRVWKACERCRMKKTKCDGEFPCKRCKDDGQVCAAGTRKKTEFKQLPRGYAEVLEHTQFALIATLIKLYTMVRKGEMWDYGEPGLNDRGQPIIHHIAEKLGCIRPNSDIDLPVPSVFPQDEQDLAEVAAQLKAQQQSEEAAASEDGMAERASSPDEDHTDFELGDHRKIAFGQQADSTATLSPVSLTYDSVDTYSLPSTTSPTTMTMPSDSPWIGPMPSMDAFNNTLFLPQSTYTMENQLGSPMFMPIELMDQGPIMSPFGVIKQEYTDCPRSEFYHVLEKGNPMMSDGYAGV